MKKVAFDTSCLLLLLDPNASAPIDPRSGVEVSRARERIDHLIDTISSEKRKAIVVTPVLAEVLSKAGAAGILYRDIIDKSGSMEIVNFDQRAAIELANLDRDIWGPLRGQGSAANPRQKIKTDRLILANCKVHSVETLYCDDGNMKRLAEQIGIKVISSWELPLPPEPPQGKLPFGED